MNPSLFLIGSATPKPFSKLGIGPLHFNQVAVTQGNRIMILRGMRFTDRDLMIRRAPESSSNETQDQRRQKRSEHFGR